MSETLDPDPNATTATTAGLVIGLYRPRYESLSVPHAVYMSTFRSGQGNPRAVSAQHSAALPPQRPRFSTPHIISHYKREEESAAVDFFGGQHDTGFGGGREKQQISMSIRCGPQGYAMWPRQLLFGKRKEWSLWFWNQLLRPQKQDTREPKYGFLMIGQQGASCAIAVCSMNVYWFCWREALAV